MLSKAQRSDSPSNNRGLNLYQSSIGKKLLTGITGLTLAGFIVIHMLGNLMLLLSSEAFNRYGDWLEQMKPLVWTIEGILLLAIVIHASLGIQIYLSKQNARPVAYENYKSVNQIPASELSSSQTLSEDPSSLGQSILGNSVAKSTQGQPSFQTLSSRTMIWTGLTLAAFIIWHLATFKFGPRYEVIVEGRPMRDLARLVIETFQQPFYAFSYVGLISLLGFHLRHGLWSALQSLGALGKGLQALAFGLSLVIAIALATGYLLVPIAIYSGWIPG